MKIKREVDGQMMEFELTYNERYAAYREEEHKYDMECLESYFEHKMPELILSHLADEFREEIEEDPGIQDIEDRVRGMIVDNMLDFAEGTLYPIQQKFQKFQQITREELDVYNFVCFCKERNKRHEDQA